MIVAVGGPLEVARKDGIEGARLVRGAGAWARPSSESGGSAWPCQRPTVPTRLAMPGEEEIQHVALTVTRPSDGVGMPLWKSGHAGGMARLRLFASAREAAGGKAEFAGATVGEVLDAAVAEFGANSQACSVPAMCGSTVIRPIGIIPWAQATRSPSSRSRAAEFRPVGLSRDSRPAARLEPSYVGGLADASIEQIRAMRAECAELENSTSFVRRLAQGRLDLLGEEATRRADGAGGNLGELVSGLADLMSEGMRAAGSGRLVSNSIPEAVVGPLTAALDARVGPSVIMAVQSWATTNSPRGRRSRISRKNSPAPAAAFIVQSMCSMPNSPVASMGESSASPS